MRRRALDPLPSLAAVVKCWQFRFGLSLLLACSTILRWVWLGLPTNSDPWALPWNLVLSFTRVVFPKKGDSLHADFGTLGSISVQYV